MPIPVVIVFVAAYAASAVILFVCAGMGFRQGIVVVRGTVRRGGEVLRIRRAEKLHQEQLAATYVARPKDR